MWQKAIRTDEREQQLLIMQMQFTRGEFLILGNFQHFPNYSWVPLHCLDLGLAEVNYINVSLWKI